ncbi:hypothetical protein LIER_35414 [Lithospermum erythrorhizon]|uniref:Uncharacterized protein n=1 Tax=Lithospermum erythrorhizon TaxID=34254 RepID=A0AAV3NU58_LITER
MEVQIISIETIKPSSPTPFHNKIFNLSLLDQLIPAPYAPLIFFYPNPHHNSTTHLHEFLENLKKSLSETLTLFYPLAGEIKNNLSIDCTEQGAHFAITKVKNINLSQFLTKLDIQVLPQLLPCGTGFESNQNEPSSRITNIQVNQFECGGLAIGICISHKILDGTSLSTFLKSWAHAAYYNYSSASSEEKIIISPDFIASSLFPTNNSTWLQDSANKMFFSMFKKGHPKTKRFVFDHSYIEKIRAKATKPGSKCPSRVETVSAFLWRCFMATTTLSHDKCYVPKKHSLLTHIVNLRKKLEPNLSEYSIGNFIWVSNAKLLRNNDQTEEELSSLVRKIRESISIINGELVKKFQNGDEGHVLMRESLKEIEEYASMEGGVDHYGFTSWCKLGFYEVDFGWGKPIWVSGIGASDYSVYMNFIVLMDTKCGEGVEAWVTLDERDMEVLVQNVEDYVDIDPSPLKINCDTGC